MAPGDGNPTRSVRAPVSTFRHQVSSVLAASIRSLDLSVVRSHQLKKLPSLIYFRECERSMANIAGICNHKQCSTVTKWDLLFHCHYITNLDAMPRYQQFGLPLGSEKLRLHF
jgi:hypothetical protein